jgi:predicted nucleotidyltransferase
MQAKGESMTDAGRKRKKGERLAELARAYRLDDIYAFGSRAAEIAAVVRENKALKRTSSSDVDIGVRPKQGPRLSTRDVVNLTLELENLFGTSRVDLVLLPDSEPFLALDIIKGELLYTEDPLDQAYFELFVLRRAGDLLPFKRERIDMILRGVAR